MSKISRHKLLIILATATLPLVGLSKLMNHPLINSANVILILLFSSTYLVDISHKRAQNTSLQALFILVIIMLVIIFQYASIYVDLSVTEDFSSALYFSFTTWTTLGYGDITPSENARFIAASQAMIGYLYMGLVGAQLFHIVSSKPD
ncbi:potassium channel family protein [Vibrio variabilis]|uniref:potassium channel family protein n=1 Tax=Vibrio variabilis TaxID=990271 RepID=UPI000DDBF950|nr:potassium channel family protein [Vibrio variabilis]